MAKMISTSSVLIDMLFGYNIILKGFCWNKFSAVSLDHSFSADKNALSSNEAALLRCSATIRYPPLSSISIVKNNITLQTTTGTTLSVRTGRMGVSTFGLYQCRVDTTGVPISLKLRIKEKGNI